MSRIARYTLIVSVLFTSVAVAAPDDVRIYEPGTLTADRYQVITRLWVESWRSPIIHRPGITKRIVRNAE